MDGSKFTQKTAEALSRAQELATEHSHQQLTPLHVAITLFEDPEGLAKTAIGKIASDETWRSALRVLKRKLVRLPSVSGAGEEVFASNDLRKCLQQATKLQKKRGDSFLSVDVLLHAILADKEIANALTEAGLNKGQIETAIDDVRGPQARVESATGDEQYQALEKYGTDLTARAAKLDPVIGRDDEIRRVIRVLCRRTKNNPVLIGDPGKDRSIAISGHIPLSYLPHVFSIGLRKLMQLRCDRCW